MQSIVKEKEIARETKRAAFTTNKQTTWILHNQKQSNQMTIQNESKTRQKKKKKKILKFFNPKR